ncbi:MAG TPA: HAMP domain-containing sensor histidine kinase, partial [bacterium]|nr:HAMP domain-containing sensor histidine kinase [bacterium]
IIEFHLYFLYNNKKGEKMVKTIEEKCRLLNYQLYLLHTISKTIKETFNENRILNVILTGLTANGAIGLSRAAVFYYDRDKNIIYGRKGIGPFDNEEAYKIWSELSKKNISLEEYLSYNLEKELATQKFPQTIRKIVINLDELNEENYFKRVIKEKQIFHMYMDNKQASIYLPKEIETIFIPSEIVLLPLYSSKDIIGIIMADNAFHFHPIDESTLLLISLISIQTGIALENANNYNIVQKQLEELKELHSAMESMQEELVKKEKLSTIGKMASYFIHEIKNPLATAGGFVKRILESNDISSIHRDADIVLKEIKKLEQILNKFSNFTLLTPMKIEKISLLDIVKEILDTFELELSKKYIDVQIDIQQNISLKAEKVQLYEILFNLISNAIENMERGTIKISAEVENSLLKISVEDTGKGIPKENIPYVIEPFFSTKNEGLGLGLFIVSNLVESYGGKLEIESVEKKGTKVKIYFPIIN